VVAALTNQVWDSKAQAFADWVHTHSSTAAARLIRDVRGGRLPGRRQLVRRVPGGGVHRFAVAAELGPMEPRRLDDVRQITVWRLGQRVVRCPCIFWPARASQLFQVNGNGISSALLIDETLDAATPYWGSLVVRSPFPHSVLLAEPGGTSHASSLSGDTCVDGTIAAYLTTGALPARKPGPGPDTTCAPLLPPNPSPDPAVPQLGTRPSQLQGQPLQFGVPALELR
jgi:hypothetical protein